MMVTARRARLTGLLILAVTFVAGALAGAATMRVSADAAPTEERRGDRRTDLFERLQLTPEQQAQVDTIMHRRGAQMDTFWTRYGPRLREIYDSTRSDIRGILTPEQREIDDRFRARRRSQMQQHGDDAGKERSR